MKAKILAVVVLAFSANQAFAVSLAVKLACRDDYFAHCSMHAVGSPGVRQCMRAVGPRLSSRCIGALADAGEIKKGKAVIKTAAYKKKYVAEKRVAKKQYAQRRIEKKSYAAKRYAKAQDAPKRAARKRYVKTQYARRYASRS